MKHLEKVPSAKSIGNLNKLSHTLGIDESILIDVAESIGGYRKSERTKDNGKLRVVYSPSRIVRKIQSVINERIFTDPCIISWGEYLYGSIPNDEYVTRDYISCAARHGKCKSILKMDISDYFDNIHEDAVFDVFKSFLKYPSDVSKILAGICTHEGRVPQGGLTSSYLANLVLHDVEEIVINKLEKKKLTYTRYVDDITVSSLSYGYDFTYAQDLIKDMLHGKGFPVNEEKCVIERSGTIGLSVHGLRVGYDRPRLPREEMRRIRANVQKVEIISKEPGYRTTHSYRRDFNRCMGRVNKLVRLKHDQGAKFIKRLNAIKPLPSIKDIDRCRKMVWFLAKDYENKKRRLSYERRFYICHERLNILKRSFYQEEQYLRSNLRTIRPVS